MGSRIVVADRSPSAVKAAELALPAPEFEVSAFGDGQEALKAVAELGPDAVLLGLTLPSRDGYEIADFVKAQPHGPQVAVFFLRGLFEPLDEAKLAPLDHDGIIDKPFDGESLLRLVRKAVDRRKEIPLPEEPVRVKPVPPPGGARGAGGPGSKEPGGASDARDAGDPDSREAALTDELEARVREIVRGELKLARADVAAMARDAVMVEVKRVLVEELRKIETQKF